MVATERPDHSLRSPRGSLCHSPVSSGQVKRRPTPHRTELRGAPGRASPRPPPVSSRAPGTAVAVVQPGKWGPRLWSHVQQPHVSRRSGEGGGVRGGSRPWSPKAVVLLRRSAARFWPARTSLPVRKTFSHPQDVLRGRNALTSVGFKLVHGPAGRFPGEGTAHRAPSSREEGSAAPSAGEMPGGLPPEQEQPSPRHREASGQADNRTQGTVLCAGDGFPAREDDPLHPPTPHPTARPAPTGHGAAWDCRSVTPEPELAEVPDRKELPAHPRPRPSTGSSTYRAAFRREAEPRQQLRGHPGATLIGPWETSHLCPSVFLHPWSPGAVEATWI